MPHGLRLIYLPPYTPELQPAEHLWSLVDEPVVNKHFQRLRDLDAVLAKRCRFLDQHPEIIAPHTHFHWWPKPMLPN